MMSGFYGIPATQTGTFPHVEPYDPHAHVCPPCPVCSAPKCSVCLQPYTSEQRRPGGLIIYQHEDGYCATPVKEKI